MSYVNTATRTWTRLSDNDGIVFNTEFRRIDANISEMMDGLAKSADYTILAADEIGLLRATNAITKETTKTFNTANPVNVADVGHGLVTGDSIVVSNSSVPAEVADLHYVVTRVNDDNFTLDYIDNSLGGGGTLDWRKDLEITLPAVASHTDNIYTIMKVDANEGAVKVTAGALTFFLFSQNDWITLKSDGTTWIQLQSSNMGVPTGVINAYGAAVAPSGYLLCDGRAVSRTTYATLFGILSTTYGVGDGANTFNVPDLRGVFARGSGAHGSLTDTESNAYTATLGAGVADETMNHKHRSPWAISSGIARTDTVDPFGADGAFTADAEVNLAGSSTGETWSLTDSVNVAVGRTGESAPAYVAVNYIIKT